MPPGADGVLWAPYLMGERTPHLDPHARAALVGLAASHTRGHVVRAILEGVAFSLRDTLLDLSRRCRCRSTGVRLGGGGARRRCGGRSRPTSTASPSRSSTAEEGAAYGAALLAGVGGGVWPTVDDACDASSASRPE